MKSIVGKKLGMTQDYDESGRRYGLSVVEAAPGVVVYVKTPESDGYSAIQVGFFQTDPKKISRPRAGVFKEHLQSKTAYRMLREFRVQDPAAFKVGQEITVELFTQGDVVDVQGVSIGKGFAGTIKRHHFARGDVTHGSKNTREPGSIGTNTHLARTIPGVRMAGQLGAKKTTVQRLKIHRVDAEKHLLFLVGGIPGPRNGVVTVRATTRPKKSNGPE